LKGEKIKEIAALLELSAAEKKERIKELDEIEENNKPIFRRELVEFHEIKKKERIKELDEIERGKLLFVSWRRAVSRCSR
jgi:hypothetical protein